MSCLDFRLKNEEKFITFKDIGKFLGFKSDAPEKAEVEEEEVEINGFWRKIAKDDNHQRRNITM